MNKKIKIAYFDCFSGISGDMILGALVDLGFDLKKELAGAKLPPCKLDIRKINKRGIAGVKVDILGLGEEKHHRGLAELCEIIDRSALDKDIKSKSRDIFTKLARVESAVHGVSLKKAHFHELGSIDTIVDVAGALLGIKKLGIKKIFSSRLNVGSGFVKCRHGILPVPAPATAALLKGIPVYSDGSEAELVTPTGAAIITTLAEGFGPIPQMTVDKIGYGSGSRDLEHPNLLRVFTGEYEQLPEETADLADVIETNIDDMNPEYYDFIIRRLLREGALDAYITNILMKKNRPGVKLSVIAGPEKTQRLIDAIFQETTTFGVRIYRTRRKKLSREERTVRTKYGSVRVKIGKLEGEIVTVSPEYEDCRKLAEKKNLPLKKIYEEAKAKVTVR
jgi:pyridinium-3,5-bisthiocarboxylic acid mononucleotide nickel chelatase